MDYVLHNILMSLRVGTFNILNTSCRYAERKPLITETLRGLECDIIGIQEVNFDYNIEDISLPGYKLIRGQSTKPVMRATEAVFKIDGNCMLVKDTLRVLNTHTLVFSTQLHCALMVWVEFNELELLCVCLHLDAKNVNLRLTELKELFEFLDGFRDVPTIVVGDFNSKPGSAPYSLMSASFRSAYKEANGQEPILTFPTGLMGPHVVIAYNLTLDYIWFRGPWKTEKASLACSYSDVNLFASDHYAVRAALNGEDSG